MNKTRLSLAVAAGVLAAALQAGLFEADGYSQAASPVPHSADSPQIASELPDQEQLKALINASAKMQVDDDAKLLVQAANLDDDSDPEIAAYTNGAVHIGSFYLLDRQNGTYRLIAERAWNLPHFDPDRWDFRRFDNGEWNVKDADEIGKVAGIRLFEVINRTGGTGLDSYDVHLCYVENGELKEAWRGTLTERVSVPNEPTHLRYGEYQIVEEGEKPLLLVWETIGESPFGAGLERLQHAETHLKTYAFDGKTFVFSTDTPYSALSAFMEARISRNPVGLMRTSSEKLLAASPWLIGQPNPHLLDYRIEASTPAGEEAIRYEVLLFLGNHRTTLSLEREELLVEKNGEDWRVTGVTRLSQHPLRDLTLPEADESSLAVLRSFLEARIKRDVKEIEKLLTGEIESKAREDGYLSLIGVSNPHLESYDLLSADKQEDTVTYHVRMHEAVSDMGIIHTKDEWITLKKRDGLYRVAEVQS
ncbi:MAG: hypothetical protein H0Z34_15345 [Brevibacillus sp.]|nr:hypothetical protein [Brevibacillus sp.]